GPSWLCCAMLSEAENACTWERWSHHHILGPVCEQTRQSNALICSLGQSVGHQRVQAPLPLIQVGLRKRQRVEQLLDLVLFGCAQGGHQCTADLTVSAGEGLPASALLVRRWWVVGLPPGADLRNRAGAAGWAAGSADQGAQLHGGDVPGAGVVSVVVLW